MASRHPSNLEKKAAHALNLSSLRHLKLVKGVKMAVRTSWHELWLAASRLAQWVWVPGVKSEAGPRQAGRLEGHGILVQ